LRFTDCFDLTIKGEGIVDGLGYDWWIREWDQKNKHGRPLNLKFEGIQNAEIAGVTWLNPAFWNMDLHDMTVSIFTTLRLELIFSDNLDMYQRHINLKLLRTA